MTEQAALAMTEQAATERNMTERAAMEQNITQKAATGLESPITACWYVCENEI
ncbi:hypothetical protein AGMMS49525_07610 [Bacteroidia bacterium]|nr:hypothetical protein AGMMS49525_07610 [Bacteroidia bacterium]